MQMQCESTSMAQRSVESALLLFYIFCPLRLLADDGGTPRVCRSANTTSQNSLFVWSTRFGGLPWSPVSLIILCGGLQAMVCITIIEYKLSTLSHSFCQWYSSVQFSSVRDGVSVLRKARMCSTPSLRDFPNVAFQTVPVFIWMMLSLFHPSKNDCRALGCVSADSLSSSSAFYIFWDVNHLWWLRLPACLSAQLFSPLWHSKR